MKLSESPNKVNDIKSCFESLSHDLIRINIPVVSRFELNFRNPFWVMGWSASLLVKPLWVMNWIESKLSEIDLNRIKMSRTHACIQQKQTKKRAVTLLGIPQLRHTEKRMTYLSKVSSHSKNAADWLSLWNSPECFPLACRYSSWKPYQSMTIIRESLTPYHCHCPAYWAAMDDPPPRWQPTPVPRRHVSMRLM